MAKRQKKLPIPDLAPIASISDLLPKDVPGGITRGKEGSVVKTEPIQPTYEEYEASGWIEKFSLSSYIEYLIDWAFKKLRYIPGEDYLFQRDELGGLTETGGTRIDFLFIQGEPYIALPVQGEHWHPPSGPKYDADMLIFIRLMQERGYLVVPLMESDILEDAIKTLQDALLGINKSYYDL